MEIVSRANGTPPITPEGTRAGSRIQGPEGEIYWNPFNNRILLTVLASTIPCVVETFSCAPVLRTRSASRMACFFFKSY